MWENTSMPAPIAVALTNRWAFASRLNGASRGLHHAGRAVEPSRPRPASRRASVWFRGGLTQQLVWVQLPYHQQTKNLLGAPQALTSGTAQRHETPSALPHSRSRQID